MYLRRWQLFVVYLKSGYDQENGIFLFHCLVIRNSETYAHKRKLAVTRKIRSYPCH